MGSDKDDGSAFEPLLLKADVAVGRHTDSMAAGSEAQTAPDSVDRIRLHGTRKMPAGIPVANTFEHETSIAEYVLLHVGMADRLRHMDAEFEPGRGGFATGRAPTHGEIRGQTVGIIGYGHIGHEVAVRARVFGMRCIDPPFATAVPG